MMKKLKAIWKDPVGSKVIAVPIVAIGGVIWGWISGLGVIELLIYPIPLWIMASIGIIILLAAIYREKVSYPEKHKNSDEVLFLRIYKEMLREDSSLIGLLKDGDSNNFFYTRREIEQMNTFLSFYRSSKYHFFSNSLKRRLDMLYSSVNEFSKTTVFYTYRILGDTTGGNYSIPNEWDETRYNEALDLLTFSAKETLRCYDNFIIAARKRIPEAFVHRG